ncbi:MAG TPA: Nif3-like dinuclear metal center hexameric protein [Fimbriimonadaceae bacterium]|nr:Nif3-like dinuclear metal center hexameric protein [Fimbriimonadaceae bacterium]
MPRIKDVLEALEEIAPKRFAFSFDNVGLQLGDAEAEVRRAVVSLDRSLAAARYASEARAQLLICHHPLLFHPVTSLTTGDHVGRTAVHLLQNGISFLAAHTNWDAAPGGVNDTLAERLGLTEVKPFGDSNPVPRLKLVVFVPKEDTQKVIDAAAEAGAGVIGLYTRCAYLLEGTGTFYAEPGTDPAIGEVGKVEEVPETRIEMVLPEERCSAVTRAIVAVHPYEEPAYDFVRLTDSDEQPIGRLGTIEPLTLHAFRDSVDERLGTRSPAWGDPGRRIRRVAVVGGAADDLWRKAQRAGADALVTGEVKQHNALEASESGFCLISAGHYATEQPGCESLMVRLRDRLPDVEWSLFTPAEGEAGRPF